MRHVLIILMLLIAAFVVFGCGDDKPTEPDVPKAQRILVTAAASAPPLNTTESAVWDAITPTTVGLSTLLSPAPVSAGITAIADTAHVQALTFHDTLYLKITWTDNSHDVWRNAFYVIDTAIPPGDTATNFDVYEPNYEEDQLWILFSGLTSGDLDGLNWRALTTDSAFLAEGVNVHNDSVLISDAGTFAVARLNYNSINPNLPLYFHPDTSAYTGFMLFEDLNILDADTSLVEADIFIRGWTLNQKVPNYIIDSSLWRRTKIERGSRWDTRSIGDWDALRVPSPGYTVVLCRPMSTGFTDDVDLTLTDSVKTVIGVFNDQLNFNQKGSERAFTKEFWLIF